MLVLTEVLMSFITTIIICFYKASLNVCFMRVSCTLNRVPHKQNCWFGRVIKWRSFIRWERSFIPMKLIWHGYLVYSLDNSVMKLCIETGLRVLTMQDYITASKTINYILFMVFCWCGSIFIEDSIIESKVFQIGSCVVNLAFLFIEVSGLWMMNFFITAIYSNK